MGRVIRPRTIIDRDSSSLTRRASRRCTADRASAVVLCLIASSSAIVALMPMTGTGTPDIWVFMVYMNADNDLEGNGILDFLELSSVDSASNLNIVVQFDRFAGGGGYEDNTSYGDWTDCRRFVVTSGMEPYAANATIDLGEVDMADWHTLVDFVNWTVDNHPADHYVLDMWDHGGDWYGISFDYASDSVMQISEFASALQELKTYHPSLVFDFVAIDECAMGSIEIASELVGYADYMLASEARVPVDGLNYSSLQAVVDDPSISAVDLCARFMTDYENYYNSLIGTPKEVMLNDSITLSTVDLGNMGALVTAIDALSAGMIANLGTWRDGIYMARNLTEDYHGRARHDIVDIYHLSERLGEQLWDVPGAQALLSGVMDAFNATIVSAMSATNPANCTMPVDHANGLSIYFPGADAYFDQSYLSLGDEFQTSTHWDEFLGIALIGVPYAVAWEPAGDSVPADAVITVWVSEAVVPTPTALKLYPTGEYGNWVACDFGYNDTEHSLSLRPKSPLLPGVNYTVDCSMLDLQGNSASFSWQFTTEAEIPEFQSILLPLVILLGIVLASRRLMSGERR